jgi:hypothetical protein
MQRQRISSQILTNFIALIIIVLHTVKLNAANIDIVNWRGHQVLSLDGVIDDGTAEEFSASSDSVRALPHGYKVLLLNSPGGSVREALEISEHLDDFHAVVPNYSRCASACASIIFIGSGLRTIEPFGLLGQHSCSQGGAPDKACNEMLGNYAFRHGVSHGSVSAFVTQVKPSEIMWFSRAHADGWGLTRYAGSKQSGFGKSEPLFFKFMEGKKPPAQAAWRIDFRRDGFEAFLRPVADDERELELNLFCDEHRPGRLFLSMELHGKQMVVERATRAIIIETNLFGWEDNNPSYLQEDPHVTEIITEVPPKAVINFLEKVEDIKIKVIVAAGYNPIWVTTTLAGSRQNLIFVANNCINQ